MRIKHCAARQIEEAPFEQAAGTSSKRDEVVEFEGVLCAGTAAHRFLDGLTESARRCLFARISDRFENDITPVLVARDGKQQLIAFKLRKSETTHERAAVALADLNDIPVPGEHVLHSVFDLTEAEVRLAQGLARGDSLKEVAGGLGIKITTARTHLASIFAKTRTRRQAKLVALLGRLAQFGA